jgi:acetoin utilization deacetylase AcuC-like enzyme
MDAMEEIIAPVVDRYAPELLLVAAGQDASQFDPNGRQCLTMAGFRRLGAAARELADRHCDGRTVLVQEGGYARTYAGYCLHATLEGVLGLEPSLEDPCAWMPDDPDVGRPAIAAGRTALGPYWPV